MNNQHGFSLTEVLVALLLVTTTSLVLLKYQWHISQWINHSFLSTQALILLDNASECFLSGQKMTNNDRRFQLKKIQTAQQTQLNITWSSPGLGDPRCCSLQRQLL